VSIGADTIESAPINSLDVVLEPCDLNEKETEVLEDGEDF